MLFGGKVSTVIKVMFRPRFDAAHDVVDRARGAVGDDTCPQPLIPIASTFYPANSADPGRCWCPRQLDLLCLLSLNCVRTLFKFAELTVD